MPADRRITVLLVDDHALVRRGFRRMLEDDPDIEVVGEGGTADEAVALSARLAPDVVVLDCAMPGDNGLIAARRVLRDRPDAVVLMLSMHAEETLVRQALDAGARGYILKSALDLDLAGAVKRAVAGETVLDRDLAFPEPRRGERDSALTPREMQVLELICAGRSSREIATALNLSVNTVSVHRANIMNALDVHKTAELVAYAIRRGLVTLL